MNAFPDPFLSGDPTPRRLSRRALLGGLLGAGAATAAGLGVHRSLTDGHGGAQLGIPSATASPGPAARAAGASVRTLAADPDPARRVLVVVELSGGNDGLATLAPLGDPTYRRLRPNLGLADDEAVWIDDHHAVHPALAALQAGGIAWVRGVGSRTPSRSHFDMEARWWDGDEAGDARLATGFLGRLCDELDAGAPVTGVSIGGGSTPALRSDRAVTLGLPDPGSVWFLTTEDPWYGNLRAGMGRLAAGAGALGPLGDAAGRGLVDALAFGEVLGSIREDDGADGSEGYPGSDLGSRLALAARLIDADVGVRVLHVPMGGFDTHDDQRGTHDQLMVELNDALTAFLADLDARGRLGSTLVATTSEFGRRPAENGSGTDHGAASVAMVCGPVVAGLHGEQPSLDRLDDEGDLVATVTLEEYYATVAADWFGVGPELVLPSGAAPLGGLVRT
jgi:uncharacterized protein (DUF1501 family)